jgi:general secretion pathway protein F
VTIYHYRAIADDGEVVEGEMDASTQSAVIERLRAMGHLPVTASAVAAGGLSGLMTRDLFAARRSRPKEIALFITELATLLRAGLPLARALSVLIDASENPRMSQLVSDLLTRVRDGSSLADAMAAAGGAFPNMHVSMVRAGEAGGTLDQILERLGNYMARAESLKESVKSALIYPMILLFLAGATVIMLVTFVVPEFQPLFLEAGQDLPFATRVVIGAGEFMRDRWWLLLLVVTIGWLAFRIDYASAAGRLRWHRVFLRLPLLGTLIVRAEVARLSRTLAALLGSGVELLAALAIVKDTLQNMVLVEALADATENVRQGQGLAGPLAATGRFPVMAMQLVQVGEESGALEAMLTKVADIYDDEVQRIVERMLRLLVPLLTIGLGVLIAGIVASILVAILSVNRLAI